MKLDKMNLNRNGRQHRHFVIPLLVLGAVYATGSVQNIQVGDEICIEGFVMDSFCIQRGTLLDNPSVESLKAPEQHSLHCLVDIASCYTSTFEMLIAPTSTSPSLYQRGFQFTDASRQQFVEVGRQVGDMDAGCTTCTDMGMQEKGFRAAVLAKVISLELQDDLSVPILDLIEPPVPTYDRDNLDTACQDIFERTNILQILTTEEQDILFTSDTDPSFRNKRLAHGSMMLIGWGILLPNGMLFARYFKEHPPKGFWFKIHKYCQPAGLLFALTGWIIALVNFDVFQDRDTRFVHGLVGSVVMALGLLQPLNAYFRPHLPHNEGDPKTTIRVIWEHYHRGAGWTCFFLAILVIVLGTTMLPQPSDQRAFQITYAISLVCMVGAVVYMKFDSKLSWAIFCRCAKKEEETQ